MSLWSRLIGKKPSPAGAATSPATGSVQDRAPQQKPAPFVMPKGVPSVTDLTWLKSAGWKQKGDDWFGVFRVSKWCSVKGCVSMKTGYPHVSFQNPPRVVQRHECVHKIRAKDSAYNLGKTSWFFLHEHGMQKNRTLRGLVTSVEVWLMRMLGKSQRNPGRVA